MLFLFRCLDVKIRRLPATLCFIIFALSSFPIAKAFAGFVYSPIASPILSATFSASFAALTADRYIDGIEVNSLVLIDPSGSLSDVNLSDTFFGTSDLILGGSPKINQDPLGTGVVSAVIPSSFFPALQTGRVGFALTVTDTNDGLFAMDFLTLNITISSGPLVPVFVGPNNQFGIGLKPGDDLPAPLPISIPIGATGSGFDEAISSKSIYDVPIPEPPTIALLAVGFILIIKHRKRLLKIGIVDVYRTKVLKNGKSFLCE